MSTVVENVFDHDHHTHWSKAKVRLTINIANFNPGKVVQSINKLTTSHKMRISNSVQT